MTVNEEKEICREFKEAKDKAEQIDIIAQLRCIDREEVISVLIKHGFEVPRKKWSRKPKSKEEPDIKVVHKPVPDAVITTCYSRLDQIDSMINELHMEYREIVEFLKEQGNAKEL